jgi:hypothetical protein
MYSNFELPGEKMHVRLINSTKTRLITCEAFQIEVEQEVQYSDLITYGVIMPMQKRIRINLDGITNFKVRTR